MKNILIIAYYFPPSGGPGVQRVLKHVKYLPEFGYNPIVLTVENGQFPAKDESLLKEIPDGIKVFRTKIFEPYDLYRMFTGKSKDTPVDVNVIHKDGAKLGIKESAAEFIRSTFFIPDARIGWFFKAKRKAIDLVTTEKISAVYTSSPPYTTALIGRHVKRNTGIPWIAGFRDPWTDFISSPNRWFLPKMIDKGMEKSVFKEANYIEAAWVGIIKDALKKYPHLNPDKFIHIPNGFDSADFAPIDSPINNKFTLTYTGSMYGRRNPAALFEAIDKLIHQGKITENDFKIKFIGRFGDEVLNMISSSTFNNSLEVIKYMSHGDSIIELQKSDLLLLVVDESKESKEIVPGKVYEYMGIRKPILVIAPEDGAIAKLIIETKSGLIAHQTDIEKIASNLLAFYQKWVDKQELYSPDVNEISKYERKNASKELSILFNQTI